MKRKLWTLIGAATGMLVLILDAKTAINGAQEGIRLCLTAVIPSLLPFFFLSILLTDSLSGISNCIPGFMSRILRMPRGSECLFLIGALGGYPTGAVCVSKAYQDGSLRRSEAERMLGFCSNAGPAFLFGIVAGVFTQPYAVWLLWGFHLLGAIAAAVILPGRSDNVTSLPENNFMSISETLQRSIAIMARVCGWIVLFRILISFCSRWFLWCFDAPMQVLFCGLLELTIGCTSLESIPCEGLRFILCSGMLAFGGLCVTMQTLSAMGSLGLGMYLPGKLIQAETGILLSAIFQQFYFPPELRLELPLLFYIIMIVLMGLSGFLLKIYEKKSSNSIPVSV